MPKLLLVTLLTELVFSIVYFKIFLKVTNLSLIIYYRYASSLKHHSHIRAFVAAPHKKSTLCYLLYSFLRGKTFVSSWQSPATKPPHKESSLRQLFFLFSPRQKPSCIRGNYPQQNLPTKIISA